jgi:holo-[acyl-carrier protein] synthase
VLIGLGHDLQPLQEFSRVEGLWATDVFFTERELDYIRRARSPVESLAASFSGKEALFKALPPVEGWFWTDAELLRDERQAPFFRLHGALGEHVERHAWQVKVSLSHGGGFVSTVVIVAAAPRH